MEQFPSTEKISLATQLVLPSDTREDLTSNLVQMAHNLLHIKKAKECKTNNDTVAKFDSFWLTEFEFRAIIFRPDVHFVKRNWEI